MRYLILILLLLAFSAPVLAQDLNQGVVADYLSLVDENTKSKIATLASELKKITAVDLAVAVVKTTAPADSENYGKALYDRLAIGQKEKGFDHGVLLLVSVLDKKVNITSGSGLSFALTPENKEKIEIGLYPYLINGKVSEALYLGSASIMQLLLEKWPKYDKIDKQIKPQTFWIIFLLLIGGSVLITLIFDESLVTACAVVAGGMFAFVLLGIPSTFVGVAIGLLLSTIGYKERKDTVAQKEFRTIYERWKEEQRAKREGKNAGGS